MNVNIAMLRDTQDWILDGGYLPQAIIRIGIRRQLQDRLNTIGSTSLEEAYRSKMQYLKALRTRPIAIETVKANEQHYEVGTGVLRACLGPRMKYSCCLYPKGTETLGQAEVAMLETYVERADLRDGMSILDLGYANKTQRWTLTSADHWCTKMRLGLWSALFRRDLSKVQDHRIF